MSQSASSARFHDPRILGLLSDFYREEFLKHQQCLENQREYYSERAILDVEAALTRIIGQLDRLCAQEDADQVIGQLLRKIDVLTGLSAWSDPKNAH
jgi:exonuclease I